MNSKPFAARSRRAFLAQASGGLGALALAALRAEGAGVTHSPLVAKEPHHRPTAKSVIWCFMEGRSEPSGHLRPPSRRWRNMPDSPCPSPSADP